MGSKTKICYIISNIDKAVAFEWIEDNINKEKFELSFILMIPKGNCYLEKYLRSKNIEVEIIYIEKKPNNLTSLFQAIKALSKIKPDIVHCHLRMATLIGLSAAKILSIKKRIYTRHHSTFHHDYFPKAIKWDKLANSLATDIVSISENVKKVLLENEGVSANKIHLIHHGFDLDAFSNVAAVRIQKLKEKYLPNNFNGKVVGIIGRYIHWKGHKYIIEAAEDVLKIYPDMFFVFANASGPDKVEIRATIQELLPSKNYVEIEFEEDLFALYQLFDIYVHAPMNDKIEAFGQTYVEALAAGVPCIFTLSGVAKEFIVHEKNALVVPYKDSESIFEAMIRLIENEELRQKLSKNGPETVKQFELKKFIQKLEGLYQK